MSFCVLHSVHGSLGKYLLNELKSFYVLSILSAHVRQVKSKTVGEFIQSMFLFQNLDPPADTFRVYSGHFSGAPPQH